MASVPTVADVFRRFGPAYRDRYAHRMPRAHLKTMHAIEACRTPALGGHLYECDHCGRQHLVFHSCKNRHCPTCQFLPGQQWVQDRNRDLLPIPYFHVVFTLPSELHDLVRANPRLSYKLLFNSASQTLLTLAADPKHLGAQIGFFAVLQTWSQTLSFHPHLHCIVTGGGMAPDARHWLHARQSFFLPVRTLSRLFRGKMLAAIKQAVRTGDLQPAPSFHQLLTALYQMEWNVYCEPPFSSPQRVLQYLGRYIHRVAVSNARLTHVSQDRVCLRYRDPDDPEQTRSLALTPLEFIRRFLLHVLPSRFVKIRYYGILANRNRKTLIARARLLLLLHPPPEPDAPQSWDQLLHALTGIDPFLCPYCRQGRLVFKAQLQPLRGPPPQPFLPHA